jgi:Peptidase S24-like
VKKASSIAIPEQQCPPPINLVAADAYFGIHDPELAGLAVALMRGDSMVPILQSGDYALIDTRDTAVSAGIFAVLYEQSVVLMQLQPVRETGRSTGRVRRTWPNPLYGAHAVSDELTLGEDATIIGRVVQKVTRHL